jgi:hypothetical protein
MEQTFVERVRGIGNKFHGLTTKELDFFAFHFAQKRNFLIGLIYLKIRQGGIHCAVRFATASASFEAALHCV